MNFILSFPINAKLDTPIETKNKWYRELSTPTLTTHTHTTSHSDLSFQHLPYSDPHCPPQVTTPIETIPPFYLHSTENSWLVKKKKRITVPQKETKHLISMIFRSPTFPFFLGRALLTASPIWTVQISKTQDRRNTHQILIKLQIKSTINKSKKRNHFQAFNSETHNLIKTPDKEANSRRHKGRIFTRF